MKRLFSLILLALTCAASSMAVQSERKQLFDDGWLFALNDDNQWQSVTLPHDWSIQGPFSKDAPAAAPGAYLPTGRGTYKKVFTVGKECQDKVLRLYFEGVYMNAEVFVNGQKAGGHPYGYTAFFVDITSLVKVGQNTVEVKVDNSQQLNSRWYSGSGIYRHVWLLTTGRRYIDEWSVSVTTDVSNAGTATVGIKAEVVMEDGRRQPIEKELRIEQPRLWSPDDPYLYETTLEAEGDCLPVTYGIRTIDYSADKGLLLNGKPIVLNGGCLHHDNGILGAAAFDAAEYRKAKLMKTAGFNAVRTAHNPPSEAFLKACDEVGLLVIDEAFDGWRDKKNDHDYSTLIDQWWQKDLGAMVKRDRNHPSIFCWSIGNEVIERKKIEVVMTARRMVALCHSLDAQKRPVTSALAAWDRDWDIYDPLAEQHDIVGYNYMIFKAEGDHQRDSKRVMMQTESYPRDAWRNYRTTIDHSYILGDFVWTSIDYLGESGIGRWYYEGDVPGESWERPLFPWHAAYCGDIDLTGQRKPISHYRSMLWNKEGEQLYMAVREPDGYYGKVKTSMWSTWPTFESWTWPGHEGKDIEVEVCSHYPTVRLLLNGKPAGEKAVEQGHAIFTLPYQPGTLQAEGIANGVAKETVTLRTADKAQNMKLTADKTVLKADGQDLAFVTVELTDANGTLNPNADNLLNATVSGPAEIIGFGNADIKDCDVYTDLSHKAWKGRALIVVRSKQKKGAITLTVQGEGVKTGKLKINSQR